MSAVAAEAAKEAAAAAALRLRREAAAAAAASAVAEAEAAAVAREAREAEAAVREAREAEAAAVAREAMEAEVAAARAAMDAAVATAARAVVEAEVSATRAANEGAACKRAAVAQLASSQAPPDRLQRPLRRHTAHCAAPPPCQVLLERAAGASAGLSAAAEAAERARREASCAGGAAAALALAFALLLRRAQLRAGELTAALDAARQRLAACEGPNRALRSDSAGAPLPKPRLPRRRALFRDAEAGVHLAPPPPPPAPLSTPPLPPRRAPPRPLSDLCAAAGGLHARGQERRGEEGREAEEDGSPAPPPERPMCTHSAEGNGDEDVASPWRRPAPLAASAPSRNTTPPLEARRAPSCLAGGAIAAAAAAAHPSTPTARPRPPAPAAGSLSQPRRVPPRRSPLFLDEFGVFPPGTR